MGGIIVRFIDSQDVNENIGRVVMLGPPNKGSELVDVMGDWGLFEWVNGPAGKQLSTADSSLVNQLTDINFELGVIAGNASLNPIYSDIIPGEDDGKVAVSRTSVMGMKDSLVMPVTHTFMMTDKDVINQTLHFLEYGVFDHTESAP
jgi:hypothetical protein